MVHADVGREAQSAIGGNSPSLTPLSRARGRSQEAEFPLFRLCRFPGPALQDLGQPLMNALNPTGDIPDDPPPGVDPARYRAVRAAAAVFRDMVKDLPSERVYLYRSPKAGGWIQVRGDTTFFASVLSEVDPEVLRLEVEAPSKVTPVEGEPDGTRFDLRLERKGKKQEWVKCIRHEDVAHPDDRTRRQLDAQRATAAAAGATYRLVTDRELQKYQVRFWNGMAVLGWINRAIEADLTTQDKLIEASFADSGGNAITLKDFLKLNESDPAALLGALGRRVILGRTRFNLDSALTRETFFYAPEDKPTLVEFEPVDHGDHTFKGLTASMRLPPRGHFPSSEFPLELLDLNAWPKVKLDLITRDRPLFERRERAIELFYKNESSESIKSETDLDDEEIISLIKRCARRATDGRPVGWANLVKFGYVRPYARSAERVMPGDNRAERAEGGGWSGLFVDLIRRHEGAQTFLEKRILERLRPAPNRPGWAKIHRDFLDYLRKEAKVTDSEYPFNTCQKAYYALRKFCIEVAKGEGARWMALQGGRNAVNCVQLGHGHRRLISPNIPFQAAALDFHKKDGETLLITRHPGTDALIKVVLPRWWIGAVADQADGFPIAESLSFEKQNTTEDVLALLESMTSPAGADPRLKKYPIAQDGLWLPGQLIPSIAHSGVDLLDLDRAWSNKSMDVLTKGATVLGCVVRFSPSREWWHRMAVERNVFREIASLVKPLPSATGSDPTDPRREGSSERAFRWEITVEEIVPALRAKVRELLEYRGRASSYIGPRERLRQLVGDTRSRWLPRPILAKYRTDNPLSWVDVETKVTTGTLKAPCAPCVRPLGARFYGPDIANDYSLHGQEVLLQVKRQDVTQARLFHLNSGRSLGSALPERRYDHTGLSWRTLRLILRSKEIHGGLYDTRDPVMQYLSDKAEEADTRSKEPQEKKRGGKAAAELASATRDKDGEASGPRRKPDRRPPPAGDRPPPRTPRGFGSDSFSRGGGR